MTRKPANLDGLPHIFFLTEVAEPRYRHRMSVQQLVSHLGECRRRFSDHRGRQEYIALTCAMLRVEGPGGTVVHEQPFSRILGSRPFHHYLSMRNGETFAIAFFPLVDGIKADRISAALAPVEAIGREIHPLLGELPKPVRERLQLPESDNWWRIVFHLGWHFPRPFLRPARSRWLAKDAAPYGSSDETFVQLHGTGGRSDIFPGLIYTELEHDLCTCSEAALGVVIEGLEQYSQTPPEAQALSADQRRAFDRLRAEFLAGTQMPARALQCKLLKLADSFNSPPASDWAGLEMGGCAEALLTLSRLNDQQEIVQIRGPAREWFCQVAERAGSALPACIPDFAILFDNIRRNESGIPVGISGPRPLMNRGALERWVAFVFAVLKLHEHEAFQIRWGTPMGPLSYGLATLDRDLCAASVLAIDLAGLTSAPTTIPTDAAPPSGDSKADPESRIAKPAVATKQGERALSALLGVFTNRLADDRIKRAAELLSDGQLTANEKLTKIDALIPLPPTASAQQLGEMLGVTKQAILKTDWWIQNRKGEKDNEIGRRRAAHRERAMGYERAGTNDDDE
jgi:hypothetical protein